MAMTIEEESADGKFSSRRPSRRPNLVGRFSSGHLVMVVAGLAGLVLSIAVLRDRPEGVRVAVADREIRAGDAIAPGDFRTELVQVPDRLQAHLVPARDLSAMRGRIATTTLAEGVLVSRDTLHRRVSPDGLRAMSVPIDASRAVGGRIEPGDRVDVLFAGERQASIIIGDARVLAVDDRARGGIGETSSPFTVTLAVDARESQLLAAAIADGNVSMARTTGAVSSKGTEPISLDRTS
jgi:pilus assembly protein CpaB